ncbi:pentapeptide repeat-containing protein [Streptomyces winkii]|uniref:pentapeptide repeat-containing protein n=1 Tax=Streptomyces winkii TaxID=3051178 RepID=UPI0028D48B57|nr:pentapeptide repeat-containing protein [Streptomyces sp. DSM 40971]
MRLTIIRVIRDHLRLPDAATAWSTYALDFARATFDCGDFSRSRIRGAVSFEGARFSVGEVSFDGATFGGGAASRRRAVR